MIIMADRINDKINIALVGYGYIAKYWEKAILEDGRMNIYGIYDKGIAESNLPDHKIYKSLASLCEDNQINTCIICTPTEDHYTTAMELLSSGKNIVMEKPSVLNMTEYNDLIRKAEENQALIYNAFHFVYSPEIAWFRSSLSGLYERFGKIGSFYSYFSDPYYIGGKLKSNALSLLGSWVDSGSNILSMLYSIFSHIWMDSLTFGDSYAGQFSDLFSTASLKFEDSHNNTGFGNTVTNWVSNSSMKYTEFLFPDTNSQIRLNHSQLAVTLTEGSSNEILFSSTVENRLLAHYTGLVDDVYKSLSSGTGNKEYGKLVYDTMYGTVKEGGKNA
jgi:predicted dehydrogenase